MTTVVFRGVPAEERYMALQLLGQFEREHADRAPRDPVYWVEQGGSSATWVIWRTKTGQITVCRYTSEVEGRRASGGGRS